MKDVLTDLNAEGEVLPLSPPREDWFGHKGMVQAAEYIRKKLQEEDIIARARTKVGISCANEPRFVACYRNIGDIVPK